MKAVVTGAGGAIGGWLVRRLLDEGFEVRAVDIKSLEAWWQLHAEAENIVADLRDFDKALDITTGVDCVYDLAEDMGGILYIEQNVAKCSASVRIGLNMLDAAVANNVGRFFFSSSACAYRTDLQSTTDVTPLKEQDAWPARPEEGYGLSKLYVEKLCEYYMRDYRIETRVARFHNVYSVFGAYNDGKEKLPAAACRKVVTAKLSGLHDVDIFGDGKQMRSFMAVEDCVEGIRRIMDSDVRVPINLGTSEVVSVDDVFDIVQEFAGIELQRKYDLSAPQGVRGRTSDNTFIREQLNWEPSIKLRDGLSPLYAWIYNQMVRHA